MRSYKSFFSRALAHIPAHAHAAAHSHHLRPDCVLAANNECMEDAFAMADAKWGKVFGTVYPAAQKHVCRLLGTDDPANIVFAPNTHEFVLRLLSCLPDKARILTTDSEFYSAARQFRRHEEAGLATLTRIAAEPFETFPERFAAALSDDYDLVFFSHVFFNSGYAVPDLAALVNAVKSRDTFIVIDGYHAFMALPVDIGPIKDRVFYMAGGYKYAMSGEGACFLHCPPGYAARPVNTGWFAGFEGLEGAQPKAVPYMNHATRFAGSTFDPAGLYRFNAAMDLLEKESLTPRKIHHRVKNLQALFLNGLPKILADSLIALRGRGNFLTFCTPDASVIHEKLKKSGLYTDYRSDRLRFGFGIYHDPEDIERMTETVSTVFARGLQI